MAIKSFLAWVRDLGDVYVTKMRAFIRPTSYEAIDEGRDIRWTYGACK